MDYGKIIFMQLKLNAIRLLQDLNISKALIIKRNLTDKVNFIDNAIDENNKIIEQIEQQLQQLSQTEKEDNALLII